MTRFARLVWLLWGVPAAHAWIPRQIWGKQSKRVNYRARIAPKDSQKSPRILETVLLPPMVGFSMILGPMVPPALALPSPSTAIVTPSVFLRSGTSIPTFHHHSLLLAAEQQPSMLDEAWSLVDKYYIDRTFNDNDWKAVKSEYQTKVSKASGDQQFQIVSDMISRLGDKYSRLLSAEQYAAIQRFDLIGVGATLMPSPQKQIMVGAPPIPGSSAALAGLQVGDLVTAVEGVPTAGKTAFDIIDQIADNPDASKVTMTIVPAAHAEEETVTEYARDVVLARNVAPVADPIRYRLDVRSDGERVGYIVVAEFNSKVVKRLEEALKDLANQQATGVVIDLRHNTGGAFQSAVEISSLFFPSKTAVYVVDNTSAKLPFTTSSSKPVIDPSIPVAIWLDDRSASASEVLAGSLHDNCRAVTLGSRSFGKGLIQAVYGLKTGQGLVLTVARYVTPSGTDIQGKGLEPDIPGHVAPSVLGLPVSTDTSMVDFNEVRARLTMCHVPGAL